MCVAIRYRHKYNGVLGGKIAVERYNGYPYLYFALITKSPGPFRLEEEIQTLVKGSNFTVEKKVIDGNTAFIVANGGLDFNRTSHNEIKVLLRIVERMATSLKQYCGM